MEESIFEYVKQNHTTCSLKELAESLNNQKLLRKNKPWSTTKLYGYLRYRGITIRHGGSKCKDKWHDKKGYLEDLIDRGNNFSQIGKILGISRERVRQICKRLHIMSFQKAMQNKREIVKRDTCGSCETTSDLYKVQRYKFTRKKAAAIRIGSIWDLSFGDIFWPVHCPILGIELDYFTAVLSENSPSFDQIKAGEGYTKDNTIIISWRANRIKNNGTATEHLKIYKFLTENNT